MLTSFFLLACYGAGVAVAVGQDADADTAVLRSLLEPHRGRHVGSGARSRTTADP